MKALNRNGIPRLEAPAHKRPVHEPRRRERVYPPEDFQCPQNPYCMYQGRVDRSVCITQQARHYGPCRDCTHKL